jgi:hypothetical protein
MSKPNLRGLTPIATQKLLYATILWLGEFKKEMAVLHLQDKVLVPQMCHA